MRPLKIVYADVPQCDGLPVHGAAGAHDEVRERDQALGVDRPVRDDEVRRPAGADPLRLGLGSRDHHAGDVLGGGKAIEHLLLERVGSVVGGRLGRRPHHNEHSIRVDPELVEDCSVRLKSAR